MRWYRATGWLKIRTKLRGPAQCTKRPAKLRWPARAACTARRPCAQKGWSDAIAQPINAILNFKKKRVFPHTRRLARRCTSRLLGTLPGIQVRAQSNDGHQPTSRATSTSRKDPGACSLSESAAPRALRGARLRKASCRSTLTQPGVPRFSGDEGIRDLRERARV